MRPIGNCTFFLAALLLASGGLLCFPPSTAQAQEQSAAGANTQSSGTVIENEWFRLVLPPGWRPSRNEMFQGALAAFETGTGQMQVGVAITQKTSALSTEEYLRRSTSVWLKTFEMVSDDDVTISWLPAKRIVCVDATVSPPLTFWQIVILASREHWRLTVVGVGDHLASPENPHYREVDALLESLQFSAPVQARLKELSAPTEKLFIPARLKTTIDAKTAHVGDPLELEAREDVRDQTGKVMIPNKARLLGRVTDVAPHTKEQLTSRLGILVFRADWPGGSRDLDMVVLFRRVHLTEQLVSVSGMGMPQLPPIRRVYREGSGPNIAYSADPSTGRPTRSTSTGSGISPPSPMQADPLFYLVILPSPDPKVGWILATSNKNVKLPKGTEFVLGPRTHVE